MQKTIETSIDINASPQIEPLRSGFNAQYLLDFVLECGGLPPLCRCIGREQTRSHQVRANEKS